MAQTANYGFKKPSTDNNVDEEFYQLQETLDLLDSILAALQTAVNGKSAVGHTHAISDVVNLAAELAAKMPASQTFKLDDLTDVDGADGAPNGYVLVKSALGWLPSSALAALGTHGHLISEITGLVDALAGKADASTAVRVDAAQSFTSAQQGRAWANIGGSRENDDLIINGCFDLTQRGLSQTSDGYGSADRWPNGFVGGTVTQSVQPFTTGDTLGSNTRPNFGRQTVSGHSLDGHYAIRAQHIEDVRYAYAGQTITVLGWARRSSGAGNMAVEAVQLFGSGGSPNVTGIGSQQVALSGLWQPFAVTINIPSVAGKTIGANSSLALHFWASAGSDFNARSANLGLQTIGVDLFGIHIRKGVVPVEAANYFSPRHIAAELELAQRYYEINDFYHRYDGITGGATITAGACVSFNTAKRVTPTINFGSVGGGNISGVSAYNLGLFGVGFIWQWLNTGPVGRDVIFSFNADAEI